MSIKLDSLLAFVLIIPFVLSHGIWPRVTSYWFFTLIFIALILLIVLDFKKLPDKIYEKSKNIILWSLIVSIISEIE